MSVPCAAPSATSPSGRTWHCDLTAGHAGQHAWTSGPEDEDDGRPHTYRWGAFPRARRIR